MPKLVAPTTIERKNGELPDTSPDDPLAVKFVQASEAQRIQRQQLLSQPLRRTWDDNTNGRSAAYAEEFKIIPYGRRRMIDIYLTLAACNLENSDGEMVFRFKDKKFKGTLEAFEKQYGLIIHEEWLEWMYDVCLEANPTFAYGIPDDDDDDAPEESPDAALTEGEEKAGEAQTQE